MRTTDMRLHRRVKHSALLSELPPSDPAELVALLKPTIDRIRRGELTLQLDGATDARNQTALFSCRFLELVDLIEAGG